MARLASAVLTVVLLASPGIWMGGACAQPAARGSGDPWVGNWRGTATLPGGDTAPVVLTVVGGGGDYRGFVMGFSEGVEVPLTRVEAADQRLVAEAEAESDLGRVTVRYELEPSERGLSGTQRYRFGAQEASFPVEMQRRPRRDVPQPQVAQRLDYFVGAWDVAYTGGEFPPLSQGTRTARVGFSRDGDTPFVRGRVTGDAWGEPYQESIEIGYDDASDVMVFRETLWNGVDLVSLGNWQSPIAVSFLTLPVEDQGRVYRLRRVFSMTSEQSFIVTDEFSVDGGPYRRLGNGTYSRVR